MIILIFRKKLMVETHVSKVAYSEIVRESDMKKEYSHNLFEKYKDDIGQVSL